MKIVNLNLDTIDKVKGFVNIVNRYDGEFDLVSGRYVVDAKSIMGIFSLDLSRDIELRFTSPNEASFVEEVTPYIVK